MTAIETLDLFISQLPPKAKQDKTKYHIAVSEEIFTEYANWLLGKHADSFGSPEFLYYKGYRIVAL